MHEDGERKRTPRNATGEFNAPKFTYVTYVTIYMCSPLLLMSLCSVTGTLPGRLNLPAGLGRKLSIWALARL